MCPWAKNPQNNSSSSSLPTKTNKKYMPWCPWTRIHNFFIFHTSYNKSPQNFHPIEALGENPQIFSLPTYFLAKI